MPAITKPTRTGYVFGGYFSGTNGTGDCYYKADGKGNQKWDYFEKGVTLYAKWTPATYTVTLDRQNGVNGSASATATYTQDMPNITVPTYSGFTFLGYFDAPTGGTKYYNANGTSAKKWDKTANTTLYAQWQTNTSINVNTQALIIDAFKWAPTNNTAITINLSANIDVNYALNAGIIEYAGQNITLDLKGKTLRQIGTAHTDIIKLAGACTLHIKDSVGGGNLTRSTANTSMSAIWLNDANANFYLDSGTITGCYSAYWGAAVCVDNGHFYMTGGTISNCSSAQYAGAVSVKNGGSMAISGGTITGCSAVQYGGGVYCQPSCTFTMTGGTISNCSAGSSGGGADLDGPFTISGGVIENCTAATTGGGLYIHSSCTNGVMSGGVVQNCQAYTYGGGISAGGTFTMSGGVIWKNKLTWTGANQGKGGGLWIGGTATMTGGYIINNNLSRPSCPAGVGIGKGCTFNMQGGIIWGNTASDGFIGGVQQDGGAYYNKTGGLVDPAIDLTLENPLAPIVNITMKEDITLTDVRSADGTVLTTADSIDFVGNQNVTWDLNGHTLDLNKYHYILVDAGATFTLKDSGTGGNITNGCAGYYYGSSGMGYSNAWRNWGGAVYVRGATFNMESGIIQNCTTRHFGGGVAVWNGTFNMTGGTIQNCTTYTTSDKIGSESGGGGVYIHSNSSFTMTNGTIKDCSTITHGGGVCSLGTFTMKDSTITGCTAAQYSGGVYASGTFNMTNGTISNCTAATYGGGLVADGTFTMTGGTITDCTAGLHSGGVFVNNGRTFNMTGGTISNCTAGTTGGGVDTNGVFNMTNGIIENCTSNGGDYGNGGGVFVWSSGSFTMTDSIIRNCKATSVIAPQGKGGAVHSYGPFTMKGNSLIYGNTSLRPTVEAPGVSLTSGGVFNLQSGIVYGNWNTADNVRAGLYTEGTGTLNQTGGYIDPKTVITLDPNGGTAGTETVTVYYGDTAMPKIEKLPTRAGYSFGGFFDAAEGGTQYYDAEGNNIALSEEKIWDKLDETMTLYARWTPNNYTISYDANGGEGAPEAMTAAYDAEVTLSSTVPTKTGYAFKEWNTAKDGSGTAYAAEAKVRNLASGGETVTLYAQWTPSTYTVTLNNGESVDDGSVTATYDAVLPDVTVPTWENHVFEGYFTEADGKGTQYIDKDGNGVNTWDKTSDTTLYAFWKDSAKIESMDLLLGGDIGLRYHVAVNDTALRESGKATVSIGSKKSSTVEMSCSTTDEDGFYLFPFTVSSVQMAEPVTVKFKDGSGNVFASDAKSVEDYYNLVKDSDTTSADQKEMVRTLVDYGYYAQQALSKTRGWSIGSDYKASKLHGSLRSTSNDLKAYRPVISGSDPNVKDIQLSLLLDSKTTLCVYVQTKNGDAPAVTVDGASVIPEDNGNGWWLVKIPDIDALNLYTMHTVTANGYTVYLSALSYASVIGDSATIDAMRALLDYYHATLKANGKQVLTSATVEQSEYDYTGEPISPVVTAYAGSTRVTDCQVEWNGNLTDAGTYTGLVTKEGYVGGVTVKVTIKPVKVEAPRAVEGPLTYNGSEQTGVIGTDDEETPAGAKRGASEKNEIAPEEALYTLENNTATNAGSYTAKATLNNPENAKNYCWDDGTTEPKTYNWRIDPMKVSVPAVETKEFTYDGNEHAVEILTSDLYTVSGNTGTAAGEYTATVTLNDKTNTCWNDGTTGDISIPWSIVIVKIKVEKPNIPESKSFAYDGTAQTLEITESEYYTVDANTGTDVGEYEAIVTLKDKETTCWSDESTDSVTIPWKITKKEIAVPTWTVNELTYTGEEQTGVTVEANTAYKLSGTTKATDAGSYTATLALTDPTNTCWSDEGKTTDAKTIVWSIARKKIGIPQAATGLVYNGAKQIGVEAGEGYKLLGVTWATNAGSYIATAELTNQLNTCWSDNSTDAKTIEWSIAKVDPQVLNGGISVTYHPNGGSVEFSGSMNVEGKFNYDLSNGTTFTPKDTTNYNTVTVEDADVTVDNTATTLTVPLDGNKEETE